MPTYTRKELDALTERGRKGGTVTASKYTPEELSARARKMLAARRAKRETKTSKITLAIEAVLR